MREARLTANYFFVPEMQATKRLDCTSPSHVDRELCPLLNTGHGARSRETNALLDATVLSPKWLHRWP